MTRFSHLTLRNGLIALHDVIATRLRAACRLLSCGSTARTVSTTACRSCCASCPSSSSSASASAYVFKLTTTKWRFISLPDAINIVRVATVLALALVVLD